MDTNTELDHADFSIIRALLARCAHSPVVVALDGGSGAGKSTLAAGLSREMNTAIVPLDDFFASGVPDWQWETFSIPQRVASVIDWSRVREEALEPLREMKPAIWYPFDFATGLREDGTYSKAGEPATVHPAPVVILDGAYSSSPPLSDLLDFTILVDVEKQVRHARIAAREDPAFLRRWHAVWDPAEEYYFAKVRPREAFDLVVKW